MKRRIVSVLLALVMLLSLVPTVAFAGEHDGQVRVIVENTTYPVADGAPWEGTLVDTWVNIAEGSTMMSCVSAALAGKDVDGADSGYISAIHGLAAGATSGWMGTLNDWFTSESFLAYTAANGKLSAGDEIRVVYTCDFGPDCGGDWSNNDKTVKDVAFSAGILDKAFDKNTHAYTLTVPEGTTGLTVTPTASNKNFQVRTYVGATAYQRTAIVPVENGTVVTVKCGDPSWPSMNTSADPAEIYTFTVAYAQPVAEKPSFEMLNVQSTVLASGYWVQNETYQANKNSYEITLKNATVSLMLAGTTKYDTKKYTAVASYQNAAGQTAEVSVNSGSSTTIATKDTLPFGQSTVTITISAIGDPTNKTDYVFAVTRPRDETKTVKNSGIVLQPVGRDLSAQLYQEKAEGTMFRLNDDGTFYVKSNKVQTDISSTWYNYRAYVWAGLEKLTLNFTGNSAYTHLRYSADDGATWSEAVQESGTTAPLTFPSTHEGNPTVKVMIQVLDDKTYAEKGKFDADSATTYTVWVERVTADAADAQILTAETQSGDWYPRFTPEQSAFAIVVPNGTSTLDMIFTVSKGATVKVGTAAVEPTEGKYTITLKTSAQTISVTSAAGITNKYSFKLQTRSAKAYADRVTDYLCINSQYTNGNYGINPQSTLAGTMVSLGSWGGYITYYFEKPLTDNPNNKYGMDFYAYGNAFASGGSAAENGQVWVSEDGTTWYALAGSEHYEDDVLWDYQVTYTKTAAGKTAWTDNQGNSNDGSSQSGAWVDPNVYYLNAVARNDAITLKGIVMYSRGGTIRGDSSTGENSYVHAAKFGYVDYFGNGTVGADVNPYIQTPVNANGFDLAWAVDAQGNAVDVSGMEFHYVKVVTASNIWAGSFNEKSTESAGVLRTTAQAETVGKTSAPTIRVNGETVTDFSKAVMVNKAFSVAVEAPEGTNVYINNQWGSSREFTAIPAHGMIRVIAQEGDKEPYIAVFSVSVDPTPVIERARDIHTAVGDSLLENAEKTTPTVGSIGGEWLMLGLARNGKLTDAVDTTAYYQSVVDYVTAAASKARDTNPSTDYSRMILALTAMDKDPTNVGGYDLTAKLGSMSYLNKQGTNGPVWALIALDSHNYAVSGDVTRDDLVKAIAELQMPSGGWYISDANPVEDVDMTAMAVQALAPYYAKNADAKSAVDKALTWLASKQGRDGDFGTSESDAQVVVALCALGRDPASDALFIKGWNSVLSAMCSYYADGASKGFKHTKDGDYNQMATEQCYYALTAYERMKAGKTFLYDMSDMCLGQHSFANWIETKAASCTETGSRSRTCTKCGVVETEEIAVLGHQMTKTPAKAPTCTAPGNNEYYTCSRCSKVFKDNAGKTETTVSTETFTATGHNWTNATCTAPKTCRKCGLTEGTTLAHTYNGSGVCTVCGSENPLAKINVAKVTTVDNSKVSAANAGKIVADNSGLVVKTGETVTQEKLAEIKDALESGSTVIKGDAANTKEIPSTSNGTAELTALANTLSGEQKAEVEKLAETLTGMQTDSTKKNEKVEMVLDLSVSLQSASRTDLAELTELPAPITVKIPISDEMYQRLRGKTVVILRSHTDVSGDVTVLELKAALSGTTDNYYVQFASDKFSTFALTSYEKVDTGHHHDGGSVIAPVNVKSAPTGDVGVIMYAVSALVSGTCAVIFAGKRKEEE